MTPLVKLETRTMKTKFGEKMRPEFAIQDWKALGGATPPALTGPDAPKPPEITHEEAKNSGLPWDDDDVPDLTK